MKTRNIVLLSSLVGLLLGSIIINLYSYEISQFNANVRVLVRNGEVELRSFDKSGIPISHDARNQREFISPFYVVHYGLIYSQECEQYGKSGRYHWLPDSTEQYWNVPPEKFSKDYFEAASDWVVNEIEYDAFGNAHLPYDFNWSIAHLEGSPLTAPWWSGLTDAHAITLLLRARDCLGDSKYDAAAAALYRSVTTPFTEGGSLTKLNGAPWIEEYADSHLEEAELSRVFNGMVYAYLGVKAYEEDRNVSIWAPALHSSIIKNAPSFSAGYWSMYDYIGNAANIKYHRVNLALIEDPRIRTSELDGVAQDWRRGAHFPLLYYVLYGPSSVAKWHYVASWVVICGALAALVLGVALFVGRRWK